MMVDDVLNQLMSMVQAFWSGMAKASGHFEITVVNENNHTPVAASGLWQV